MTQLRIRILRLPGVEVTDETVTASRYISAMLSFCRLPLALLSRGAGSLLPRGFGGALTQLRIHLSLVTRFAVAQETVAFRVTQVRCCVLQHTLVENELACSAYRSFDGNSRSGNRKNRIVISVNTPLNAFPCGA